MLSNGLKQQSGNHSVRPQGDAVSRKSLCAVPRARDVLVSMSDEDYCRQLQGIANDEAGGLSQDASQPHQSRQATYFP